MFYSQFILAKKGPLGTIWIAAHLERKLRKNQVAETDIGVTVDNILFPEVPIALRLSGHLLLGVVRIYSRQVNYLFNDCSETLGKIKQAFHAAAVDLPPEATTAPFHSITLPETFDFDELELAPDSESSFLHSNGKYVDHHVTTREQITLQDCIQNNPYLGSSQFGLDERFGDGSYSSLGLDFDEEFWASKAGSSSVASTSTPLLKEDTVLPPAAGGENEVTHMDVDDPYEQPLESELQKGKPVREAVNTEAGQIETDNQLNVSVPPISLVPFNEPGGLETATRKDSGFAALKHDVPSFHAYTPRVLEACTPDLNREYCPPDEPSTPALADETSLPMYNECNPESAGRFSPVTLGNNEKSSSDLLAVSSSLQQVSCVNTFVSSVQATSSPSPASFQGFPLQQAAPAETNREAFLTQKEKGQFFAVKENAASASTPFQSFPQPNLMQQTRTPVSHEGAIFPTGPSASFSTTPEPSLSSLHQRDGNPSMTANHQSAGTVNQEVFPHFQQQGLAVGLSHEGAIFPTGTSSFSTTREPSLSSLRQDGNPSMSAKHQSAGTVNQEVYPHFQQQGLAVGLSHEGAIFPTGTSSSFSTTPEPSLSSLRQQDGNPSMSAQHESSGTVNQEVYPHFQRQGLAVGLSHEGAFFPTGTSSSLSTTPEPSVSSLCQRDGNPSMTANHQSAGTVNHEVYPHFQQQGLAVGLSHEGSIFPTGISSSFSTTPEPSLSSLRQRDGNLSMTANHQSAGTVNQEVYPHFQQQGLAAVGLQNPVSSYAAMVEPAGSVNQEVYKHIQQQGLAVGSQNPVSSFGAMVGSAGTVKVGSAMVGSAGTVNNGIYASSQQQGLAVGSQNPVSSFGAMSGSAGTVNQGTYPSFQQQGFAVGSQNPVSSLSSFGAIVESAGSVKHGVHGSSQQQGLAVGSQNPVSSFGAMAGSAGTVNQATYPSFQQQGLLIGSQNPVSSLSSFGATVGSAGTVNHGVHASSQQQGLAVGSQNPVSTFGAVVGSTGTVNQGAYPSFQQQGLAVGLQNPVSSFGAVVESTVSQPPGSMRNIGATQVLASPIVSEGSAIPLFSASSGSLLPVTNVLRTGHMESMNSNKETTHETLDSAASKGVLRPSATQQLSISSPTAMPGILSSMSMGECETLRSAYDLQSGSPGFLMLQKDMSVERIPGLELERNKSFSVGTGGFTKEATLPAMDKTPIWREETPYSFTRPPLLSTHSINYLPADDDVLASILGRSKGFKVVPTPKAAKEPKVNVAKRPKRAPRVTPKKRKIDLDTVAVLHGDVIRQQLANAEDIRRERRKAPCTRREVWAFIRENEGQENFDEPTLPELSHDLHDLYHDVLHGPESRPSSSALNGAVKANQPSESQLIRSGETNSLVDGVNNDANKLGPRGDSDHLVDCTNKDSSRDVCMNEFVGNSENNLSESLAEQSNEDAKLVIAQTNACGGSMDAEDAEKLSAKEFLKPEADSEGLAGKERDRVASPEPQHPEDYNPSSLIARETEDYNPSSLIARETEANEQAEQILCFDREVEASGPTQKDILVSSLSENVVGIVGADEGMAMTVQKDVLGVVGGDVGTQERAMAMQHDTERLEEKQQLSFAVYEHEVTVLGKEADFKALDIPSDGKDLTEVPMSDGKDVSEVPLLNVVDMDKGNMEGSDKSLDIEKGNTEGTDKLPTSNVTEEETNLCRDDEDIGAMECERDADFLDEDNDVAYAEIDYSSDEQDASIQDSNGWSARSRNVGRYLKTAFEEMEGNSKRLEQGPTIGLERLLTRKTKREAARMFFETLVLKTKDYIHVEQNVAFQDIRLYPKSKLMKTEF